MRGWPEYEGMIAEYTLQGACADMGGGRQERAVPLGKYPGTFCYLVMEADGLVFHTRVWQKTVEQQIPYDQIAKVIFQKASGLKMGFLCVRSVSDGKPPVETSRDATEDTTSLVFGADKNDLLVPVYEFLNQIAAENLLRRPSIPEKKPGNPLGFYPGIRGYLKLEDRFLILHKQPLLRKVEKRIPLDQIRKVYFRKAEKKKLGFLCIRSWEDCRPVPASKNAAADETTLVFGADKNALLGSVFEFLNQTAVENLSRMPRISEEKNGKPTGLYQGARGYLKLEDSFLILYKRPLFRETERMIPLDRICQIRFLKAENWKLGFLCIRSWEDNRPVVTGGNMAGDETTLVFGSDANDALVPVAAFLETVAADNRERYGFREAPEEQEERPLRCPQCQSDQISQQYSKKHPFSRTGLYSCTTPMSGLVGTIVLSLKLVFSFLNAILFRRIDCQCQNCGYTWTAWKSKYE